MSDAAQVISKREQKRQARLAREQAEKTAASPTLESIKPEAGVVLPVLEDTSNPGVPTEQRKLIYTEPIQRRIRAYLKKKQKIDNLTERSQDPEEKKKLNADQLEILARQDQVLAPLKELQQLADQLSQLELQESHNAAEEAKSKEKTHEESLASAKAEGYAEGKKVLESVIAFLGYASILRANPSSDKDFNDAAEKLLTIIYSGGEQSTKAASLLENASSEHIEDTDVSYKSIRDVIYGVNPIDEEAEPADEPHVNGEVQSSNFISLSELAENPSTIVGGISFLNESEIEGVHAPEEITPETHIESVAPPGPAQAIINNEGNSEANAAIDWNATSTVNWADEVLADPIAAPSAAPTATPRKKIQETRSDDFKTIEGKARAPRGRGERGRGRGRGRGDRARGN